MAVTLTPSDHFLMIEEEERVSLALLWVEIKHKIKHVVTTPS